MKANVLELMEMKANKKLIQSKVQAKTCKVVTLRDLSNTCMKRKLVESFEETVEDVKKTYGCHMVCTNATYKLVDTRIPLCVLLIEDSNGQSEIAALGLLVNEENKDMKEHSVIKSLFPMSCDMPIPHSTYFQQINHL
ncbi:zinc finger SWIM domain-containing protein 3-like [Aphis craccivora]|uniref:Zinc finger SWIM domain-containing protein 3-like n=1 Tax=Aphis craccivora TaxID=307492 RepID=A0A6G0Z8Q1_APHCR|nr:zinc finger SWIM domain-containing protein 3-like [Aphis craccivora]